ncbi:uncharacterized protein L969DRAFT_373733 [Mixia osmundae IAM 14324]|uniref:ACB domain-containing protein n=1 Tax=Mixia osmundae (strain CBS 9802 / IAM 14324 / JCM 22182 / KY 12970) TaxID=764103 RepID=G7DUF2_MIXOS|nr:uncharacterized protein L969DRAFT_373733 [Mixia osmundae IAM 14324]KEI41084.1 hypothetical protein L969DRAFT_373733 [Mixia osmundae IAM 14324]GAA94212.1 hypothetical protein E5Q_00861 [Mixia osmundae IAM 14324]
MERAIDAQFERAVDMIQSLPKSGPIQTSYEDKLLLYSLYKQATEGPPSTARPGMLDMLGRAKWDAWKRRAHLTPVQAKAAYIDALRSILRTFSDRPTALTLIKDLDSHGPRETRNPAAAPDSLTSQSAMSTSSSTEEERLPRATRESTSRRAHALPGGTPLTASSLRAVDQQQRAVGQRRPQARQNSQDSTDDASTDDGSFTDEAHDQQGGAAGFDGSAAASQSHHRQPRPLAASQTLMHPPAPPRTNSVYSSAVAGPVRSQPPTPGQYYAQQGRPGSVYATQAHPGYPHRPMMSPNYLAGQSHYVQRPPSRPHSLAPGSYIGGARPVSPQAALTARAQAGSSRPALDRALDNIQVSLAALHERLQALESSRPAASPRANSSPLVVFLRGILARLLVQLRLRDAASVPSFSRINLRALAVALFSSLLQLSRRFMTDFAILVFLASGLTTLRKNDGNLRVVVQNWGRLLLYAGTLGSAGATIQQ